MIWLPENFKLVELIRNETTNFLNIIDFTAWSGCFIVAADIQGNITGNINLRKKNHTHARTSPPNKLLNLEITKPSCEHHKECDSYFFV